jgi:transglutaminase-like putative cysteine protease
VRDRSDPPWWAEVPLILVHLVVVAGFARVFDPGGWFVPLLALCLLGHALAIGTRRLRLPGVVVVAVAVVGFVLGATWTLFADTTRWGLPTTATLDAARAALDAARAAYPVVVAPTEALPGFVLAAGLGIWASVWFGDATAHRVRATAEAIAPAVALFTFCAILGSGRHQVISALAFAAAAMLFVAAQRAAAIEAEQRWLPTSAATARSVLGTAAIVGVVALGAAAVIGPALPGAGDDAALSWRQGEGDRSRVTVSPMVELRKRLVEQSDQQLFTVEASQRSYWRLTSLDRFDGEIWSSSGDYDAADDDLTTFVPPDLAASTISQTFEIDALAAIWAPAAFEAISVRRSSTDLRWDPESSTLIVDSSRPTTDGTSYAIVSRSPAFDPQALEVADPGAVPPDLARRYTSLPEDFPRSVARTAEELTADAATTYDAALALQTWFRTEFDYSLDSPPGHGDSALVDFLDSRVGYCEQFAGAFAAMARSLGIPARVAVGFTPGVQDPEQPDRYTVLGRHAHAWPELWFTGSGWVPFEPTPGRGLPGGEAHTGVPAQQDDAGAAIPSATTSTTVASTTTPSTEDDPVASPTEPEQTRTTDAPEASPGDDRSGVVRWATAVVVALAATAALVVSRRRRRQPGSARPAEVAWRSTLQHLEARVGLVARPDETPLEVAQRGAPTLDEHGDALLELADLVTDDRWSPEGLDPDRLTRVEHLRQVLTEVQERSTSPSVSSP